MRNGQTIIRRPGESLYDAATQYNSIPIANLVTLSTGTSQLSDYSYHPEDIDSDDEYSDSDSDSDDRPYLKYVLHAKQQLYYPTSYQEEKYYKPQYQVYPVERTPTKQSTKARKKNSRVLQSQQSRHLTVYGPQIIDDLEHQILQHLKQPLQSWPHLILL